MKKSIYVVALTMLFLSACKNDKKQVESVDMNSHEMQMEKEGDMESSTQKSASISAIIDGYLLLKNALVKDDNKKATEAGEMMLKAFSNFDMAILTATQHTKYMEIAESAKEHAEHIVKNPIDHQREHFEPLSIDINDLITLVGTDKTLYQTFCPMAFNNKGAIWLSETKEISNPYFGSEMLTCGSVQKQIN